MSKTAQERGAELGQGCIFACQLFGGFGGILILVFMFGSMYQDSVITPATAGRYSTDTQIIVRAVEGRVGMAITALVVVSAIGVFFLSAVIASNARETTKAVQLATAEITALRAALEQPLREVGDNTRLTAEQVHALRKQVSGGR